MEDHFGSDLLQRPGQEVRASHPRLESFERVFHGLPTHAMVSSDLAFDEAESVVFDGFRFRFPTVCRDLGFP